MKPTKKKTLAEPVWARIDGSPTYRKVYIEGLIELLAEKEEEIQSLYAHLNPPAE